MNGLRQDLDHILEHTREVWEQLRGSRVFMTGGTGFFGRWLMESFSDANRRLGLKASMVVLTRDEQAFTRRCPELAGEASIALHSGDVRSFRFPEGRFTHVIHAATPASAALNQSEPLSMLDTIIEGTRRTLDLAVSSGANTFLLTSSGAVYGRQPVGLPIIPETYAGVPDTMNPEMAYAEGKRVSELLCSIYSRDRGLHAKIARCFAFIGPGLPLDAHFAAGNFIRDALSGSPIRVNGDGTPLRSYLYAADLAIWLWTILARGESCRPYNVGSSQELTILELAEAAAALGQDVTVQVAQRPTPGTLPQRYLPDVERAERELGLEQFISLSDSLRRTAAWCRETVNI